jgi:hypothetical protein
MLNNIEIDKFNLNIDELLSQIAGLIDNPINSEQAHLFLLLLWGYFEVSIVETHEDSDGGKSGLLTPPDIIQVEKGYPIFDYGMLLKTSPGKLYGSYATGRLLTTVSSMIDLLVQRGAKRVKIDGLAAAKRFGWVECENKAIKVINFKPDPKEKVLRFRL